MRGRVASVAVSVGCWSAASVQMCACLHITLCVYSVLKIIGSRSLLLFKRYQLNAEPVPFLNSVNTSLEKEV